VFTARYALSPYIKQIRFVFKGLITFRDKFTVTIAGMRNLPAASHCTNNHSNGIIIFINYAGTLCLLQNAFGPGRIDCGLRLSENISSVSLCMSHQQSEGWATCRWPVPVSFLHTLFGCSPSVSWSLWLFPSIRIPSHAFCQRIESEVVGYIYVTPSSLVEIHLRDTE
jgi:hypothetical protein